MASDAMHLGLDPGTLRVILTTGGDFDAEIIVVGGDWEPDETLTIILPSTSWAATLTGDSAVWHVASSIADGIPEGAAASLKYTKGAAKQIWEIGTVIRRG